MHFNRNKRGRLKNFQTASFVTAATQYPFYSENKEKV